MITSARAYVKSIMQGLGYKEWRKSLEPDNIPKAQLESFFHIKTEPISGVKQNQRDVEADVPLTVSIGFKTGGDEVEGYEDSEAAIDAIVKAMLSQQSVHAAAGILRVRFDSATPAAIGPSNDNAVITRVQFTVTVVLDV